MARISARGSEFALVISAQEMSGLGLSIGSEYEIAKAKDGVWVLLEKENKVPELDSSIISLLKKKRLNERVEGRFEKFLNDGQLARFRDMLKEGRIVAFRLSLKYKKAVYKTPDEIEGNEKPEGTKHEHGCAEENAGAAAAGGGNDAASCLEKDGFLVCTDVEEAKRLSWNLKDRIKEGGVRGLKGFDGRFYIIEDGLYRKYGEKVLGLLRKQRGANLDAIAAKLEASKILVKIVLELLKEEGEVLEKRRESYEAVE